MDVDTEASQISIRRKGKARADPEDSSETTPLLGSSHSLIQEVQTPSVSQRGRRLLVLLSLVFVSSLGLCLLVALIVIALSLSYNSKITNAVRDEVLNHAVLVQGPDSVNVLNATEGSLWIQVDIRVGLDAGKAIDIVLASENRDGIGAAITTVQRMFARRFVRQLEVITITTSDITVLSDSVFLSNVTSSPITLPLSMDTPEDMSWLTSLTLPVHVNFTKNSTDLLYFAQESWKVGYVSLILDAHNATVRGGPSTGASWRNKFNFMQDLVSIPIHIRGRLFSNLSSQHKI